MNNIGQIELEMMRIGYGRLVPLSYNARVCDVNTLHLQNRNYSQVRMNGCTYLAYKNNNMHLIHLSETASLTVTTAALNWLQQQSLARLGLMFRSFFRALHC
jgi:hypothetical protein